MALRGGPLRSSSSAVGVPGWRTEDFLRFETDFLQSGVVKGVGSELAVSQRGAGANLSVDVATGRALISTTSTLLSPNETFKSWLYSDAVVNVPIATADPTNPRKDRIVAKFDMSVDPNTVASNIVTITVVAGTPAGSPSAPAEPANAITLAIIAVAAGATSIVNANITDSRPFVMVNTTSLPELSRQGLANNLATVGGTGDVITLTLAPVPTAYAAPMVIWFIATAANTTAVTVNVNGLGAKNLKRLDGATALVANDIKNGQLVCIGYDGTNFQVISARGQDTSVQMSQIGFYGDANDGAVTWSADTNLNPATEKRYTTATLDVTKILSVTSVNTPLVLHNTGNVTINGIVDMNGKGGAGGSAGGAAANGNPGTAGASKISGFGPTAGGGATYGASIGSGGGGGASVLAGGAAGTVGTGSAGTAGVKMDSLQLAFLSNIFRAVACGAGGGGGSGKSSAGGGAGGAGGGALVWYIGGNLTLGASSIIRANGANGANAAAPGGGGGGGGIVIIIVAGTITNGGVTITAAGGTGGVDSSNANNGGGGGDGKALIYSLSTGTLITS